MGVVLDTETELFLGLLLDFNDEKACEHSLHTDEDPTRHHGTAKWYTKFSCFQCGDGGDVRAFCDRWKGYVESGPKLWCECGYVADAKEFYRHGWTKIDT